MARALHLIKPCSRCFMLCSGNGSQAADLVLPYMSANPPKSHARASHCKSCPFTYIEHKGLASSKSLLGLACVCITHVYGVARIHTYI